ncbi:hypothetical protein CBR_g10845 [Chara braunii]|uniref:Uncharacterized protein n=1 Tax=Chara braunii TaxID=69332 RepID=A0A388KPC6_CHABU|nr:hypothetical protein CBR_g10845 [Chara braunii]|eukprot:GBG71909.1 hypothetical protein CBR_g10845 [Chara braunii]
MVHNSGWPRHAAEVRRRYSGGTCPSSWVERLFSTAACEQNTPICDRGFACLFCSRKSGRFSFLFDWDVINKNVLEYFC